ncbi:NAD(P)/FAD-dependent oxidoreductase [Telluria beijingensis]|uniref:NAD(P)/FAD-dependent oxidoreductase n=1 Tax=Telluria beijingensis TaxID=3068633 RepID=UPI0027953159|nr:FAD-dependent oxidoreductase [Massilia sp. REN29]
MAAPTIVVIGAGQAGAWAARTLRSEGYAGRIVLVGDEAHPPYERPPLSKEQLQLDPAPFEFLLPAAELAALDIAWRPALGCCRIDRGARAVVLDDGSAIPYDKLILATGGHARLPQLPGIDAACVHTLRTLDDARRLRAAMRRGARVLVIGGGWIGLEAAAAARALDCAVTVVEAGPSLCARSASPLLSNMLAELHRANGVDLRLASGIEALEQAGAEGCSALFADGSRESFDLVVVGIGLVQSDGLARAAGLRCERGIVVDRQCRTSDPDIYAAGDVTAIHADDGVLRLESWQNAQDQGIAAARAALGQEVDYRPLPYFWSQQYETMVQLAGVCGSGHQQLSRSIGPGRMVSMELDAQGRALSAIVTNSPRDFRTLRKFVADGARIDAARFADPAVPLPQIVVA